MMIRVTRYPIYRSKVKVARPLKLEILASVAAILRIQMKHNYCPLQKLG